MHYVNEAEQKLENIKCDIRYCREKIEGIRTSLTKTNVELKQTEYKHLTPIYAVYAASLN